MSAGEFLSAILQDSRRAVIFGENTAGAGGSSRPVPISTYLLPDMKLTYTWTIGRRTNGEYIEDVGIAPDVSYEISVEDDIRSEDPYRSAMGVSISGFQGYRAALLDLIASLVEDPDFIFSRRPTQRTVLNDFDLNSALECHRSWRRSKSKESSRQRFDFIDRPGLELLEDDLSFIGFTNSNLRKSVFRNSKLSFANFFQSDLSSSDFSSADLSSSYFGGATLQGCNLIGADLRKAVFKDANLRGCNFTGAKLRDTVLTGAELADAVGLNDEQLLSAYFG
jgi:uncharacterized protein YjbI with pentapeptide repeats